MADSVIDPQLSDTTQPPSQSQPSGPSVTLPIHNLTDPDNASEGDVNDTTEKRRKLNLWKCKQCRDARKKCLPEGRVWPQKCQRCLQHRPEALECSEPQLNTRKRGPNLAKDLKAPQRTNTDRSTPDQQADTQEPRDRESHDDHEEAKPAANDIAVYERPARTLVTRPGVKREHPGSVVPELTKVPIAGKDDNLFPAAAYLPLGPGEFRVLRLNHGTEDDKIICSFITTSMRESLEYEAVSYLYGGGTGQQKPMVDIRLQDSQGKQHKIYIIRNIYNALRSLRHPEKDRLFWIDGLCVVHPNKEEKSQQVTIKRDIIRKAVNLCFWLGEDASSKDALRFIPRILDLTKIDSLVNDNDAIREWVAFVDLLKNPVFSRLWLVQEVAIARNVTLHCGIPAIHYSDLVDAVGMFLSFRDVISALFRRNQKSPKELRDRKMLIAERFIDVSTTCLRTTSSGSIQRQLTLEALVSQLSELAATAAHDRIYAVLAIAKDGLELVGETLMEQRPADTTKDDTLRVDYNKKVSAVYQAFVIHAIKHSRSLDIICRHWASSVSDALPTWVRPLQSFQPVVDSSISERTEADSLVNLPDQHYYNASRGRAAESRVVERPSTTEDKLKSLHVRGFRVDTISKLGFRASEGIIFKEWLLLGNCDEKDELSLDNFWRTLVANRGPNGSNTRSWYSRAFEYCYQHLTPTGDINTNRLIAECEKEVPPPSLVIQFLERVQSVIWNRRFLVSKENKWIGLAPMAAELGDVIAVLHGCSVPVVLRPLKEEDGTEYFWLVGECYVHGLMEGEAADTATRLEKEFEIR